MKIKERFLLYSLKMVEKQYGYNLYKEQLKNIACDYTQQYTEKIEKSLYNEYKIRNMHCFQALFTAKTIKKIIDKKDYLNIVDIGDSAGTHIRYIKNLLKNDFKTINGISVNLDKEAVDKINILGGNAILCRAEDYEPANGSNFYLSYEMVEHLHNPALFFHRLARANKGDYMVVTVPYVAKSRVALRCTTGNIESITAEMEHIFELSPTDWKKIMLHSGWKVIQTETYLQYPSHIPLITCLYRQLWKHYDFEGFIGFVLKRDMSAANRYLDWEE